MDATEQHRFRCEVLYFIRLRLEQGEKARDNYLALVKAKRGAAAADALRGGAVDQWTKGNRGGAGEWR
jgi:hypothetical protein